MLLKDINHTYTQLLFAEPERDIVLKILDELSPFVENYQFLPQYRMGILMGESISIKS